MKDLTLLPMGGGSSHSYLLVAIKIPRMRLKVAKLFDNFKVAKILEAQKLLRIHDI